MIDMEHTYRHHVYAQPIDLTGKDLISLSGGSRDDAARVIPDLVAPADMAVRSGTAEQLTAYNGELADEVHEFTNAKQGSFRVQRLLLKEGRVVELAVGW